MKNKRFRHFSLFTIALNKVPFYSVVISVFPMFLAETHCYKRYLLTGHKHDEFCKQKEKMPKVTIALEISDQDVTRFGNANYLTL